MNIVENNIKKIRREKKITQDKFRKLLNVSISSVRRYETGDRIPQPPILREISNILGVSISTLFATNGELSRLKGKDTVSEEYSIKHALTNLVESATFLGVEFHTIQPNDQSIKLNDFLREWRTVHDLLKNNVLKEEQYKTATRGLIEKYTTN